MTEPRRMTLAEIFGEELLAEIVATALKTSPEKSREVFLDIINKNIQDINQRTGQENDPKYLMYVLVYSLPNPPIKRTTYE